GSLEAFTCVTLIASVCRLTFWLIEPLLASCSLSPPYVAVTVFPPGGSDDVVHVATPAMSAVAPQPVLELQVTEPVTTRGCAPLPRLTTCPYCPLSVAVKVNDEP